MPSRCVRGSAANVEQEKRFYFNNCACLKCKKYIYLFVWSLIFLVFNNLKNKNTIFKKKKKKGQCDECDQNIAQTGFKPHSLRTQQLLICYERCMIQVQQWVVFRCNIAGQHVFLKVSLCQGWLEENWSFWLSDTLPQGLGGADVTACFYSNPTQRPDLCMWRACAQPWQAADLLSLLSSPTHTHMVTCAHSCKSFVCTCTRSPRSSTASNR